MHRQDRSRPFSTATRTARIFENPMGVIPRLSNDQSRKSQCRDQYIGSVQLCTKEMTPRHRQLPLLISNIGREGELLQETGNIRSQVHGILNISLPFSGKCCQKLLQESPGLSSFDKLAKAAGGSLSEMAYHCPVEETSMPYISNDKPNCKLRIAEFSSRLVNSDCRNDFCCSL